MVEVLVTRPIRPACPALRVGDMVEWGSQSKGHLTYKEGWVVAVVPPEISPSACLPAGYRPVDGAGFGMYRRHESYLVATRLKRKQAYWPRVHTLRLVERKS